MDTANERRGNANDLCSISDLESKIGAGLIEEVIQVAEAEHELVDVMIKSSV